MSFDKKECQGQHENLLSWTGAAPYPSRIYKFLWHLRKGGLREAFEIVTTRIHRALGAGRAITAIQLEETEVLDLQPGEWVKVKPKEAILATLDTKKQFKGLAWIPCMNDYCGKEYQVYKRVENIVLESTGEIRKAKHTVLLEGVICEGLYGCNRSCFPFWREIWLERIKK